MPCALGGEDEIPIALFGTSNLGRLKTLYREGLSNRYGKIMQTIAGIHYNFSMPESFWPQYQQHCGDTGSLQDFRTNKYLHLIRNFHRYSWLLVYLFGASPAACKSFVRGREHSLQELDAHSLYLPYATCLRMGNLGYKSEAQKSLFVCYNDLNNYAECLDTAMHTPYPEYEAIGLGPNGEPLQINANLLQLENEFYSTIRPKRNVKSGQRPLAALKEGGIEYIEVRALDLNPYLPLGIDAEQIRFLDTFLVHCLLAPSPECHQAEFFEVAENLTRVVEQGRDPALMLSEDGKPRAMRQWAATILESLGHAAALLDSIHSATDDLGVEYASALQAQIDKLNDSNLTPSGRMLAQMQNEELSFFQLALTLAQRQHEALLESPNGGTQPLLSQADEAMFEKVAKQSLADQAKLEAEPQLDFETFLAQWNAA
jgi:glutamate--cysteine ligase